MIRFDIDRIHEIRQTILRNRSRSLLTGFGVFWGIFMLLFLMGGGQGVKALLQQELQGFATNSGFIVPSQTSRPFKGFKRGRTWKMTRRDIEILRNRLPEAAIVTGQLSRWGMNAVRGGQTYSATAKGVYPDYVHVEMPKLKYGRYINAVDLEQERKVCVLGKRVYESLFPEGGDPCGQLVQLQDSYFRVVGVDYGTGAISINGSSDRAVVMPVTVMQKLYNRGDEIDMICMTARSGVKIKTIMNKARGVLSREHAFDPEDKVAMFELNAEEMFGIVDNLFRGLNILIWLIGFGTLLAAAIGVSNIMMVSVKERTTEIGIRRAIGATPKMILSQIMSESVILTVAAGMFGIMFSVMVLSATETVVSAQSGTAIGFQVSFGAAVLALGILMVLGLLAGLAPAYRAMAIRPVDAMRDE